MLNFILWVFPFKSISIGSFELPNGDVEITSRDVAGDVVPGAVSVIVVGSGVVVHNWLTLKVGPSVVVAGKDF